MNDLDFACVNCKLLVDAGYRWAYWTLQVVNAVSCGEVVPANVLAHTEYWEPSEPAEWLVKEFEGLARC